VGDLVFTADGLAKRGLLLRHLVMPGLLEEGRQILAWAARELGRDTFVNVMGQFAPATSPLLATGEHRSRRGGGARGRGGRGWGGGRGRRRRAASSRRPDAVETAPRGATGPPSQKRSRRDARRPAGWGS
jgi:hypothetical protein